MPASRICLTMMPAVSGPEEAKTASDAARSTCSRATCAEKSCVARHVDVLERDLAAELGKPLLEVFREAGGVVHRVVGPDRDVAQCRACCRRTRPWRRPARRRRRARGTSRRRPWPAARARSRRRSRRGCRRTGTGAPRPARRWCRCGRCRRPGPRSRRRAWRRWRPRCVSFLVSIAVISIMRPSRRPPASLIIFAFSFAPFSDGPSSEARPPLETL